ncbi:MAG TPA: CoA transferase [Dehalococcoidales bacterium]|nr:CoA transferase [Dehalococcoidales bacterium]
MALALHGVRVLDITDAVAGPFCTMLLAQCGAEVIRPESRRHLGFRMGPGALPRSASGAAATSEDEIDFSKVDMSTLVSPNFARFNLNKLSAALNLTKPEARELFKKLVKVSDVVVDNLSFGITHNWGLDYQTLKQIKKDIIVVSMPSLGKGPHQEWTTWGMNLLSFTGFAYSWGHPDTPVEERAASNYYGDYIAGMKTAASILAALYHKSKTGDGQYVEVAQAEVTASLLGMSYIDYFFNNRVSPPKGNRDSRYAPYNSYRCKGDDRWCVIAVFSEGEWQQFRRALDSAKWTDDPKFQTMEARLKNVAELDENIEKWTRQYTPHQVMKILQSAGVAAGAVENGEDLYFDIQLRARGHMLEVDSGRSGRIIFDGPPVHLSDGQRTETRPAPILGADNDYVYKKLLGLTQAEIDRLTESKVIF